MNRKKTFFIVLVSAVVAVGAIFALTSQKEKEMNPEEVLGEDIQKVYFENYIRRSAFPR